MAKKVVIYISINFIKLAVVLFFLSLYFAGTGSLGIPVFSINQYSIELIQVLILGIALGTDAFSLSIGIGMANICRYQITKISVVIGLFHIIMPLIGFILGELLGSF